MKRAIQQWREDDEARRLAKVDRTSESVFVKDSIKKYEALGFRVLRSFPGEYTLLYNEKTTEKVRVYLNHHIEGPYR